MKNENYDERHITRMNRGFRIHRTGPNIIQPRKTKGCGARAVPLDSAQLSAPAIQTNAEPHEKPARNRYGTPNDPNTPPSQTYHTTTEQEIRQSFEVFATEDYQQTTWYKEKNDAGKKIIDKWMPYCIDFGILCTEMHTINTTAEHINFIHVYKPNGEYCGHKWRFKLSDVNNRKNRHSSCYLCTDLTDEEYKRVIHRKFQLSAPTYRVEPTIRICRETCPPTIEYTCNNGHRVIISAHVIHRHRCLTCEALRCKTPDDLKQKILEHYTRENRQLRPIFPTNKKISSDLKMTFVCPAGHHIRTMVSNYLKETFECDTCFTHRNTWIIPDNRKKITDKLKLLELPGQIYTKNYIPLEYLCTNCGALISKTWIMIRRNSACGQCSGYKSEMYSRQIMEFITAEKFKRCRPAFLRNYELDGYCEKIRMAMEFQGEQHFRYIEVFYRGNHEKFRETMRRDREKIQICETIGIQLICIPYDMSYTNQNTAAYVIRRTLDAHFLQNRQIDGALQVHRYDAIKGTVRNERLPDPLMDNMHSRYNYRAVVSCQMCQELEGLYDPDYIAEHMARHFMDRQKRLAAGQKDAVLRGEIDPDEYIVAHIEEQADDVDAADLVELPDDN